LCGVTLIGQSRKIDLDFIIIISNRSAPDFIVIL